MNITYLGHAGLFVETEQGSILCDPWFNPAYFGSWWPFPANDRIDRSRFSHPTYLYISHLHHDHFDPLFLKDEVDPQTTVLLPDYPITAMRDALSQLGFHYQVTLAAGQVTRLPTGLKVAIWPLVAPADGPLGDSYLWIDDGSTRVLNLNDAHPRDLEAVLRLGRLDALFLQFSGAIWYPMVYDLPREQKASLGAVKRVAGMRRAEMFIHLLKPKAVFPSAGPAAFLDDDLFEWNDFNRDDTNTFPDQTVFLDHLAARGIDEGHLVLPGSKIELGPQTAQIEHHLEPGETIASIFEDKRGYLQRYQRRVRGRLEAEHASWPLPPPDLFARLRRRLAPIMHVADLTAEQIGADIVLDWGGEGARLDFIHRKVVPWHGGPSRYYFRVNPALITACLDQRLDDWVNSLFLSFRFRARRDGEYNEAVYTFFKCLSPERIQFAEGYWIEQHPDNELWLCQDYWVQRRCPHMKADLQRFATVDDNQILTCHMHGWRFDLKTGQCLNSHNRTIYRRPVRQAKEDDRVVEGPLP
ncbi:MAG: (2Fe-2S)-binding protein [Sulfobacillus acidophilus]|uniref:(2Fe-2S)-binding protein n=1 Tax=Sulfobacillus acidophilus TaxID=53633 RepID=A0A2T2WEQ9_9FIRM|nr:MAG: (2Fe-2S)-binding protein [Sulfobacillus acidophilus]